MINPIRIHGEWDEGYALDKHTVASTYVGEDIYGKPSYNNIRSDIGEALYQFKYNGKYDKLKDIIELASPFLDKWKAIENIDVVVPVPPSNKSRKYQPVFEIAREIANHLGVSFAGDVLVKKSNIQLKDKSIDEKHDIVDFISARKKAKRKFSVLVVDDLIQSGTTLNECIRALRMDENLNNIYVLAITKTKG